MMTSHVARRAMVGTLAATVALAGAQPAAALNLFSVEQEIQIGRQAAADAERKLPMVRDSSVEGYVNAIVRRLAAAAPGARYPYRARVVNASDINAFALPGGYLYVNRGLIQSVRTEGELAGVLAHEMAHIAQRHGTEQVSKAYAAQAGLGALVALIGGKRQPSQVAQVVSGLGLNLLFLKFSRDAENEADTVGAQMMARAGYDPMEMATFFDLLQAQRSRNPGSVEQFFSSHPSPANRSAHIRAMAQDLGTSRRGGYVGNLRSVQSELNRMGPAPTSRQILGAGLRQGQAPRARTLRQRTAEERRVQRLHRQRVRRAQRAN